MPAFRSLTPLPAPTSSSHHTSPTGSIIFGIALVLIGTLHAVKPDLTWRMSRWQYRNRGALEPSGAGLVAIRIGGAIALVVGIVVLIIAFAK